MVSVSTLLQHLPAYQERETVIVADQRVHDIIREVMDAHRVFASHYDDIQKFFTGDLKELFDFCKKNISYQIETEDDQTTRSPAATLELGHGDCKHYAGFIAGVLDAMNREGANISWKYRFASYDVFNSAPGHVFVIVKEGKREIWIDPVLESFDERLEPTYITDKKVIGMLTRLSGIGVAEISNEPRDYPVAALAANVDNPKLYAAIELLLKTGVLNADGTVNVDDYDTLQDALVRVPGANYDAVAEAFGIVNDAAVNGLGESIAHALAKVTLAIPRAAYLALVALNVFGLASKLFKCIYKDDSATTYYQPGQDTVYKKWYLAGGDWGKLAEAVKSGHKKKAILSGRYQMNIVGAAPAIPVWVASATVIIAALGAAISQVLKARGTQDGLDYNIDPATGLPYGVQGSSTSGGGFDFMTFIKENILLIGGGIAAYLYIKNRK